MARPALDALREQQKLIDQQQHMINRLMATASKQHSQIQRLTAGLTVLAANGGEELVGQVKVAMIRKRADEQNPAQPVPEPAPEPATSTTAEAEAPEVMTNVTIPGLVPGSTNDVAANAVSTAYTPGMDIASPVVHNLVDPTRPVDGTQGPRPVSETITHPEVRVGNPMNPQTAYPLTGPFANAQRTAAQDADATTTMAALRLARLKIAAGVEQGEDIALAQRIASSSDLATIQHDINTYTEIGQKAAARRAQGPAQAAPRGVVPRTAGVQRTVPALGAAPQFRTTASADGVDPDIESIFINL